MHARGLVSFLALSAPLVVASVNVTVPARDRSVKLTGAQWRCRLSPPTDASTSACDAGCSTTVVGESLQYSFRGSAIYMTLQQDANADITLAIELDGAQTRYTPYNLADPGCAVAGVLLGGGLDPTRQHTLTVSMLPGSQGAFVFGGLTVTVPESYFGTPGATSSFRGPGGGGPGRPGANTTAQSPFPGALAMHQQPRPSKAPIIAGVLGGVLLFWVAGGIALFIFRRRQRKQQQPERTMVMTIDPRSTDARQSVASIRPFPVGLPPEPRPSSFNSVSKESLAESGTLTKWQRELLMEHAVKRYDQGEASGSGSRGAASPPPVYTPRARERAW
ncbi:hypothetical protein AURDEDRAFT_169623 [Auricularia subglabra TFB-10046 SS5]|nr:hypothetical protein AURDEDRAFT_169623 [Auricularia subglabra TFB-10046 SS5]